MGSIPAALIPVALVLFFSDQNTKKWMEERKEIALAILQERKEWLQERKDTIDRQFALQDRISGELSGLKSETSSLRPLLQDLLSRVNLLSSLKPKTNE